VIARARAGSSLAAAACWLLVAACALVAACHPPPIVEGRADPADTINTLWAQIRDWRREAGLALDPACAQLIGYAPDHAIGDCAHVSAANPDTCALGEAICDNAETICVLADEMRPNLWAHDKCNSALASCREVKQLCVLAAD
jgi:hypothetical protein